MNKHIFFTLLCWPLFCLASSEDALISKHNQSLLAPLQSVLQQSSVVITNEEKVSIGYGCVVSNDGHILSKASKIAPLKEIFIRLNKGEHKARILETSEKWDVALLKVDVQNTTPLPLAAPPTKSGHIVVSNGVTSLLKRRLKFGIIAANARAIPFQESALDLNAFPDNKQQAFIVKVLKPGGAAQKAGIQKGDLISSINGEVLSDLSVSFNSYFKDKWPGEKVTLTVTRDNQQFTHTLELQWLHEVSTGPQDRNEAMSGRISVRRTGFPSIIQHDIPLSARTIGGPLLNLKGECIGMNIARFSRSETYAIPSNVMHSLLQEWKVPR